MNIRVALGAQPAAALALVVKQGAIPIAAGLAVGTVVALAAARAVAALLFDVNARDPSVIGAVVAVVGAIGLAACTVAARRGLTIDPAAALRDE